MSTTTAALPIKQVWKYGDLGLVIFMFGTLLLLIQPVHPRLMDLLLSLSIASALLILLVILYLKEPCEFTGFPTLLLIITLFRLGLNVASTRLILLDGYAGEIINAFGNYVVRGNYVVGTVVFLILTVINFIVITKGAGRIAEVAARFTLDALPGKQMSIDAELNAGLIKEDQARARRAALQQEADFYGAMDGASKFVRGDAVAAVLITLVNVLGGFGIGVLQRGLPLVEALQQYTILSIGDGLVSQVPALITSTAAGILVTRAASKENLGYSLTRQLFFSPRALAILSGSLGVLAVIPGLPTFPFLVLAGVFGTMFQILRKSGLPVSIDVAPAPAGQAADDTGGKQAAASSKAPSAPEKLESLLNVDTLQIELGYGLVALADVRKGGDLLERVTGVRRNFVQEMGFIIPPIRLRDNLQLGPNEYRFLLRGHLIAKGEVMPGHQLAMNTANSKAILPGIPTTEPVFQLPAIWIKEVDRRNAEVAGFTVVDPASVLVTHLSETIKRSCHQILSRQDVQVLLENLKQSNPALINELVPTLLNTGQIQRILQNLLAEGVPIRNLVGILERVADYAVITKNPDELSEQARRALGPQITKPYQTDQGGIQTITIDPWLEEEIAKGLRQSPNETLLFMEPKLAQHVTYHLSKLVQPMIAEGRPPVVICSAAVRLGLRRFFAANFPEVAFLAYEELPPKLEIAAIGSVPSPA
ncbi:MAG: flagellar biosynthesis protein FlhA [Verrucomicrobia bacterium]|nr:flagellar biosynthesis protein FlhA [Verrucomicrobiota bacterium]